MVAKVKSPKKRKSPSPPPFFDDNKNAGRHQIEKYPDGFEIAHEDLMNMRKVHP